MSSNKSSGSSFTVIIWKEITADIKLLSIRVTFIEFEYTLKWSVPFFLSLHVYIDSGSQGPR